MAIELLSPDYITPDNDIWLLKLIPLEQNYENTILWEQGKAIDGTSIVGETIAQARARQFTWFTSTSGALHISATTYQREGRKYIRVDKPMKDLIGYNYLVFKNEGTISQNSIYYENKYYYAFITSYEYLNDRVTIVHYAIDLMQTYNFDYVVDQCFVEREHSSTDNIGENLLDEGLETGELISNSSFTCLCKDLNDNFIDLFNSNTWNVIIAATFIVRQDPTTLEYYTLDVGGGMTNGVYNGVTYIPFNPRDATELANLENFFITAASAGKESGIVSVFTMPEALVSPMFSQPGEAYQAKSYFWDIPIDKATGTTLIKEWSYSYKTSSGIVAYKKPSNKKLYTMPYTKLVIYNGAGSIAEYGFENFDEILDLSNNKYIRFRIYSATSPNPEVACVPCYYKGVSENFVEKLTITQFPQCAYTIDSYRAWMAQNKYRIGANIGSNLALIGAGALTGNPFIAASGSIGLLHNTFETISEIKQHQILPPQLQGQITPYLSVADSEIGFKSYSYRVKDEYAKIIDDYFTLYGYACKKLKIPNRNVRENWCYCKTIGCRLTGTIPGDVDDKICSIYNSGIRFWLNPNNIGRYDTLTNNCITPSSNNTVAQSNT